MLKRLTAGPQRFDPDCLNYISSSDCRRDDEDEITFSYFGHRLEELADELENPRPHGRVERWLERRSSNRYNMLAVLIGIVIAIVLGVLALIVSVVQTWMTYMAWKHPVTASATA